MNALCRLSLLLSLGLPSALPAAISTESPFVSRNGQVPITQAENTPIELRGVMATPDGMRFAIYEPATQKGNWVKKDETGFPYVVRNYDPDRMTASVEYQGRVQALVMKEAKFDGTVVAMAPAAGAARPGVPGAAPAVSNNAAEEQKRLEQVANEVRRRRAARQAAMENAQQQPQTTTQPVTTPQ
jgi:hypothetical protein